LAPRRALPDDHRKGLSSESHQARRIALHNLRRFTVHVRGPDRAADHYVALAVSPALPAAVQPRRREIHVAQEFLSRCAIANRARGGGQHADAGIGNRDANDVVLRRGGLVHGASFTMGRAYRSVDHDAAHLPLHRHGYCTAASLLAASVSLLRDTVFNYFRVVHSLPALWHALRPFRPAANSQRAR